MKHTFELISFFLQVALSNDFTKKFDVLRSRLLGNHNDFLWQLGGQINHQPCNRKAARVIRCTELDLLRTFA